MSARSLTRRHMAKVVRRREGEATDPEALQPDQMRLYSFYKPGLVAADYVIEATQSISATTSSGKQSLSIRNTVLEDNRGELAPQEFEVVVPRFSLDPNLINSYYPPDGHQDEGRILPHIVLNDPHYPWEILAGMKANIKGTQGKIDQQEIVNAEGEKSTIYRSMVPWVALLVFDPDELHLDELDDLTALRLPGYSQETDVFNQNPKGTFTMTVAEYLDVIPKPSRINYKAGYVNNDTGYDELTKMKSSVDVIFPKKELFKEIFETDQDTDSKKLGVEAHKYLAHVRHINTIGFPDAGVEEEGLFSIVISSRTGQYDKPEPRTQVCHLVSIEHVDSTLGAWLTPTPTTKTPATTARTKSPTDSVASDRIGMISLFSWIYTSLPPNPVNFVDTMRNLTEKQQMLRVEEEMLAQLEHDASGNGTTKDQASKLMVERLKQGYTISRWRTQSGEETAAFTRGPLVPQTVRWPIVDDIPDCSNTSQEYQILDPQTGLMDLSYSSAWQAGKLLAISDTVFSAALMRFRSAVHNSSAHQTRMMVNQMQNKSAVLASVRRVMTGVQMISSGSTREPQRFRPPSTRAAAPGVKHEDVKPIFLANVRASVQRQASAGDDLYNEFNLDGANNSDWVIIHNWLCEKLSLGGIPPQYLLPEPSFLPPESLRFFHIDDFWLDCLLDGALSVANQLDVDDDVTRREIKEIFNTYLRKVVPKAGYKPQIPSYGFVVRSQLIKAMPDLRITVAWRPEAEAKPNDERAPVCRWTKWDDETLMCLLDRQPEELDSITLAQPPHQQRFSLGSYLKYGSLTFDLRRLYTSNAHPEEWPEMAMKDKKLPNDWINFDTRVIKVAKMAKEINEALQFGPNNRNETYNDPTANSCELGLELNDPSYYFKIVPPSHAEVKPRDRQLWTRPSDSLHLEAAMARFAASASASKPAIQLPSRLKPRRAAPAPGPVVAQKPRVIQPKPRVNIPKPPHQQLRIQPVPVSRTFAAFASSSPITVTSKFELTIYPDYKGPPTRFPGDKYDADDYIPTNNIYFFDLIFSIRKTLAAKNSNYELLRIDVDVPMATTPPNKTVEALLSANYDGPGLRMLSNQRFIPFLFYSEIGAGDKKSNNLHIELVPRSAEDKYALKINDRKSSEVGVRLAEANISPIVVAQPVQIAGLAARVSRGVVTVTMTEWYKTTANPGGEPVSSTYDVLKRNWRDDS